MKRRSLIELSSEILSAPETHCTPWTSPEGIRTVASTVSIQHRGVQNTAAQRSGIDDVPGDVHPPGPAKMNSILPAFSRTIGSSATLFHLALMSKRSTLLYTQVLSVSC